MVAAPECAPRLLQSRRAPARGSATDEGRVSGGLRSGLGKRGSGKRTQKEAPLTRAQQGCVRKTASFFSGSLAGFQVFGCAVSKSARVQATAAAQGRNFAQHAPAGRIATHVHTDETCARPDPVRNVCGAVALTPTEKRYDAVRDARLGLQRSAFTLLAFVADTDGAQAFLPQTILGSKRVLPQRVGAEHIGRNGNICVLSAKCACLSAAVLCRIL